MRILFLGNNWVGWQIARWLSAQGENIVGAVVHPEARQRYRNEILQSIKVRSTAIFDGARLRDAAVLAAIQSLEPDIAVSIFFGYILRPEFLSVPAAGCINLHPALLPYNRGAHPNVWSIVEGTPAGVTLHYIDAGVDTGDIIAQRPVTVEPVDTGATLYRRLEKASIRLFQESWPLIRAGKAPRTPQAELAGSCHRSRDVEAIDEIDLTANYPAKDLIDRLRARSFPPHRGVYFKCCGRRIYLNLHLEYGEEVARD